MKDTQYPTQVTRPDRAAKLEARVPEDLRAKFVQIALLRQADLSDVVRDAFRQYITRFEQQTAA